MYTAPKGPFAYPYPYQNEMPQQMPQPQVPAFPPTYTAPTRARDFARHRDLRGIYRPAPAPAFGAVQWTHPLLPSSIHGLALVRKNISSAGATAYIHIFQDQTGKKYIAKEFRTHNAKGRPLASGQAEYECEGLRRLYNDSRIRRGNIVDVYGIATIDVGNNQNIKALVMEYMDGPDGATLISSPRARQYSEADKMQIIKSTIQGLLTVAGDTAKAGIVHNDIKPDNLMYDKKGYVKVIDWGGWTESGQAPRFFTKGYAAPETGHHTELVPVIRSVSVQKWIPVMKQRSFFRKPKVSHYNSIVVQENRVVNEPFTMPPASTEKSDIFSIGITLKSFLKSLRVSSAEADDLIAALTTPDPAQRLSAIQARRHPFFHDLNDRKARDIIKSLYPD